MMVEISETYSCEIKCSIFIPLIILIISYLALLISRIEHSLYSHKFHIDISHTHTRARAHTHTYIYNIDIHII